MSSGSAESGCQERPEHFSGSRLYGSQAVRPASYRTSKNQPVRGGHRGAVVHHQGRTQVFGVQLGADLLGRLTHHRRTDILAVLDVSRRAVQQSVPVARAGPAGEQHLVAPAQDQMDVDHFRVTAALGGVGDQCVPLVVHGAAPERGIGRKVLVLDAFDERGDRHRDTCRRKSDA